MKTLKLSVLILTCACLCHGADDLKSKLQAGLFEEEANHNLPAAIAAYQAAAAQFDKDRELVATAIFRLGECYRKMEKTNEAAAFYQRIRREFPENATLARLSQQNLIALRDASVPAARGSDRADAPELRAKLKELLTEQVKNAEQNLADMRHRINAGTLPPLELPRVERELVGAKRRLLAVDAPLAPAALAQWKQLLEEEIKLTEQAVAAEKNKLANGTSIFSQVSQLQLDLLNLKIELALGEPPEQLPTRKTNSAAARQVSLIQEDLKLAEQQLALAKRQVAVGTMPTLGTVKYEREVLRLKRELAAAESDGPRQQELFKQEIGLVEKQVAAAKNRREAGRAGPDEEIELQRELLALKGELAALEETPAERTAGAIQEEAELKRLQALLKDSPDLINAPFVVSSGWTTPLHGAVTRGQATVVQFLLENKADLEVKDSPGRTALILAAENGQKNMVELLLAKGAFVQAADKAGDTALHTAARRGYRAVAEVLLAHKANINTADTEGLTPLHAAAAQGFNSVIELLLDHGANLEAQSDYSNSARGGSKPADIFGSPLQMAVRAGHKSTVELLLARKAKPNAVNPRGLTPLHYAAAESAPAIAETLLRGGASVDVPASDKYGASAGWTPLHFAVARGSKEMVELLLTNKADPNLAIANDCDSYGEGYTALCMAVAAKKQNLVELLLAHGANPNVSSKSGSTPLMLATVYGSYEIMELLLMHKADPDLRFKPGSRTPLMVAGPSSLAELLLRFKANPNLQDEDGDTALHLLVSTMPNQRMPPGSRVLSVPSLPSRPSRPSMPSARFGGAPDPVGVLPGPIDETMIFFANLLLTNHANVNLRNGRGLTPLNIFGVPATPRNKTEEALIALLRQYGAKDALSELEPDPNVIRVWRQGQAKGDAVFARDTNGLNSFTLMDTILAFYNRRNPSDGATGSYGPGGTFRPASWWLGSANYPREGYMAFPDLGKIQVGKLMEGRGYVTSPLNLLASSTNLDCSSDLKLQFGDVVEIPEREHTLNEPAVGMTDLQHKQLLDCVPHRVWVIVKGKRHALNLTPGEGLYLSLALASPQALAILVSSSDLSRVQVQRHDPKTGAVERTFTNDLTAFRASGKPFFEDLALRHGDVIGVPETGSSADPLSEGVPPPSELPR